MRLRMHFLAAAASTAVASISIPLASGGSSLHMRCDQSLLVVGDRGSSRKPGRCLGLPRIRGGAAGVGHAVGTDRRGHGFDRHQGAAAAIVALARPRARARALCVCACLRKPKFLMGVPHRCRDSYTPLGSRRRSSWTRAQAPVSETGAHHVFQEQHASVVSRADMRGPRRATELCQSERLDTGAWCTFSNPEGKLPLGSRRLQSNGGARCLRCNGVVPAADACEASLACRLLELGSLPKVQ